MDDYCRIEFKRRASSLVDNLQHHEMYPTPAVQPRKKKETVRFTKPISQIYLVSLYLKVQ